MNNENQTIQKKMGLTLKEIMIKCQFKNQPCNEKDFQWYFDKK